MTKQRIRIWPLVGAVLALSMAACGDDDPVAVEPTGDPRLGTVNVEFGGGLAQVFDPLDVTVSLLGAPDLVLLELDLGDNDHGNPRNRGVLLMDSSHPSFADVVERLTDGAEGSLQARYLGGSITVTQPLSAIIDFDIERAGGELDFVDYEITALRWTVDLASLESPGNDNNGDGIWTDVDVRIKIEVEGRPE